MVGNFTFNILHARVAHFNGISVENLMKTIADI